MSKKHYKKTRTELKRCCRPAKTNKTHEQNQVNGESVAPTGSMFSHTVHQ